MVLSKQFMLSMFFLQLLVWQENSSIRFRTCMYMDDMYRIINLKNLLGLFLDIIKSYKKNVQYSACLKRFTLSVKHVTR